MALPASDNFNRANENPLAGNWTTIVGRSACQIVSNTCRGTVNGAGGSGAYWNADTFGANQYAQATCGSGGGYSHGPALRISPSASTFYMYGANTSGFSFVIKCVAGEFTFLGGNQGNAEYNTIKLEVTGTTLTPYINGVAKTPQSDSAISTGQAGVFNEHTARTLDNWSAGNLGSAGPVLPVIMNHFGRLRR